MRVLLLGFGKIGRTIFDMLHSSGRYQLTVGDSDERSLQEASRKGGKIAKIDVASQGTVAAALQGQDIVINALPHHLNIMLASEAVKAGVNYFDLSEDVASTKHIKELAKSAKTALMPQCGLAPGFIAIAAHDVFSRFDSVREVQCRVGALPLYPTNSLKYNLTWSTDGLINEYCMPCEAIHNGQMREYLPLEGLENFTLNGVEYECFNTSGGIGTLCETLLGKVENLNYKTVRYPGHCAIARVLINELGLGNKRPILKEVLESAVPMTTQDKVLVFVSVSGQQQGRFLQENFVRTIYGREVAGEMRSAIQVTTAAGICTAVDLFATGKLPKTGFIRQEHIKLADFLANPFGQYFAESGPGRKAA